MLDTFSVNFEFREKEEDLFHLLMDMWNTEYSDLYDEEYFDSNEESKGDLEDDLEVIFDAFSDKVGGRYFEMLMIVGRVLCLASFPYLKATLSVRQLEWFESVLLCLESGTNIDEGGVPSIDELPGSSSEAAMVFFQMLNLINKRNVKNAVLDMLDGCVAGTAICPGIRDKRAIFNWLITDVFPCAYCRMEPSYIYTINTELPGGWGYEKADKK